MVLKEKDFIEIEFTGKTEDGEIFDSNRKEDLEKANLNSKAKPFIFSLGQGMFLEGVEEFLKGKSEESKEYKIELPAEKAFGKRDSRLIQRMPSSVFREQNIRPVPGILFNFDGRIGKVIAVSGGRVIVDFNNTVAGKDVIYYVKILRKVEDINEKIKALNDFLFRRELDFSVDKEKKKVVINTDAQSKKFIELFKDKFKEILDMNLEVKEKNLNVQKKKDIQ